MSVFIGIDTSNYTTSVAIYDTDKGVLKNCKKLLPVNDGEKGLMQSKALFEHTRQLPEVLEAAFSSFNEIKISGVGVSNKPRNLEDSYMPVFLSGVSCAAAIASSNCVNLYKTSHQVGHVLAALYSANRLDLINEKFIAFHCSGGTTEALLVEPDKDEIIKCKIIAQSLDLKAGQAIDRVGVMLGLPFPAGAKLDELSLGGVNPLKIKTSFKNFDCSLSGVENKAKLLFNKGESAENIARFTIEYIKETIIKMSNLLKEEYNDLPMVYSGGVMSNSIIKEEITKQGGIFCESQFSSDNAAGVAVFASLMHKREV